MAKKHKPGAKQSEVQGDSTALGRPIGDEALLDARLRAFKAWAIRLKEHNP